VSQDELERSPFGRRVALLVHRLPRSLPAELDWELERGYHLQVLSESFLELNLRPREPEQAPLPLLGGTASPGLSKLLIWQKQPKDQDGWAELSSLLCSGQGWQAGLILSRSSERGAAVSSFMSRRKHWTGVPCAVVQVFQDSPPASFFSVEKNLFVLGRVGRRLERLAALRRWMPW
jgi:hypothetical protein